MDTTPPNDPAPRWRGSDGTRLEAFVDAAFAFAVTLLVISVERIPDSVQALLLALKSIPAFAASFTLVVVFWYAHVRWSRRYRLDTVPATLLTLLLVFMVLVYVYPLRLLMGTFFAWISGNWLPMPLNDVTGPRSMAHVFMIYGFAFASMSACIGGLYALSWRARSHLGLNREAAADTAGEATAYAGFVLTGLASVLIAALLSDGARSWQVAMAGSVYFLLSFTGLMYALGRRWGLRAQ